MPTKLKKSSLVRAFVKTKLGYHLDQAIGKGDFTWEYQYKPKQEDNAWHPSGHCTPSTLELYHYAADTLEAASQDEQPVDGSAPIQKNRKEGFTPALYKTFQVGHFWHAYLQKLCLDLGFCEADAIERKGVRSWGEPDTISDNTGRTTGSWPKPFHWVTGSADIAPCEIPGHGPYLIDFKTMNGFAFKPNLPPGDTAVKWECQLNVYMDFFDLEKALILGINKDSPHDFKEFEFHRNEELINALYAKWELVAECLERGVEPKGEIELPTKGPVNV